MLDERKLRIYAMVAKVLGNEPISSADFNIWLSFVQIPPILEQLTKEQTEAMLAQQRALLRQYGTPPAQQ